MRKPTAKQIEKGREILKRAGYLLDGVWQELDIKDKAEEMGIELTDDEVSEVAENIERSFDAEFGINWEVIATHIDMFDQDRKKS